MTDPQFRYQPDPPPVTEVGGGIECGECGAPDPIWTYVEYSGPTGVTSPDGGQEQQHQSGWRCSACKEITEESDG